MSEEVNDPGSTQSVDQMSIARELNGVLEQVSIRLERIQQLTRSQADFINSMTQSFSQMQEYMTSMSENSANMQGALEEAHEAALETFNENKIEKLNDGLEKIANTYEEASNSQRENLEDINKSVVDMGKGTQAISDSFAKSSDTLNKSFTGGTQALGDFYKNSVNINSETQQLAEGMSELNDSIKDLTSGYGQMVKNAISGGWSIVKSISSFAFSLIGAAAKFVKFAATVPFTITKHAVNIGNTLRRDIVEVIQAAQEALKEKFDMDSEIGKGIQAMTNRGKGMLLSFQNPSSELVKLFGFGASGIANMIGFLGENLEAMGHFSEVFGKSLGQDMPKFKMFTKMVKAFGFSSEDVSYLALDAATSMKDINIRMGELGVTLSSVSQEYGVDRKRLSKNVMILRRDITQFGHLSDEELARTTARLTQMKVKLEDAASVFKKFSTFEDAANSVAMLSQTFGMNLDAMDMIKATNPEEIIDMFRNSMLETGKSFQDLNRFEKDLMAQHTGMSAESLSALMNYRDLGLTHQEAVKRMEAQKPAAKQMEALKKLNSSIKEVQKVMTFDSPFKAFFKGLSNNVALSKDLRSTLTSLSSGYQGIYEYASSLDPNTWSGLIKPIKLIVDIMSNILRSDAFKGGLVKTVSSVADFVAEMFGASSGEIILNKMKTNVSIAMQGDELKTQKQKDSFNKLVTNQVKSANISFINLEKLNKIKDPSKLLSKLESYRSKLNKDNQLKFDAMMKVIAKDINKTYQKKNTQAGKKAESVLKTSTKTKDKRLAEGLLDVVDDNTDNLAKLLKLSGKIAGAVLKGAVIGASAIMRLITAGMTKFEEEQSKVKGPRKNIIEEFLHFEPGEFGKLGDVIGSAISDLIFNTKNIGNAASLTGWLIGGITDVFGMVFNFFVDAMKGGINEILGKEIFEASPAEMRAKSMEARLTDKIKFGQKGSYGQKAEASITASMAAGDDIETQELANLITALDQKSEFISDPKAKKAMLTKVKKLQGEFDESGGDDAVKESLAVQSAALMMAMDTGRSDIEMKTENMETYYTAFKRRWKEISKIGNKEQKAWLDSPTNKNKPRGWKTNRRFKWREDIPDRLTSNLKAKAFMAYIGSMPEYLEDADISKRILKTTAKANQKARTANDIMNNFLGFNNKFAEGFLNILDLTYGLKATPNSITAEGYDRSKPLDTAPDLTSVDTLNSKKPKVQTANVAGANDFISDMFDKILSSMPNLGSGVDIITNVLDGVSSPDISEESLFGTFNIADYNPLNMFSSNTTIPKTTEKKATKEELATIKQTILNAKKEIEEKGFEVEGNMIINDKNIKDIAIALLGKNFVGMMSMPQYTQGVKSLAQSAMKDATGNEGAHNNGHSPSYNTGKST